MAANVVGRLTDETGTIYLAQSFAVGIVPPLDIGFNAPFALREQTFMSQRSSASTAGLQAGDFRKPTQKRIQKQISEKIKLMGVYTRFVCADVDGNGTDELILLSPHQLELYFLSQGKLQAQSSFKFLQDITPIHLHAGDFNHNGKDELYITAVREVEENEVQTSRLSSMVVELRGKHFAKLGEEYPYYFRVLEERKGRKVLMAQKMGEYDQYLQPIWHLGYKNGTLKVTGTFRAAKNIFSIYQFVLNPLDERQVIILDQYGGLAGFDAIEERVESTAGTHFGVYDETSYAQRLRENDVVFVAGHKDKIDSILRWSSRRFLYAHDFAQQAYLIKKERTVNPENLSKLKNILAKQDRRDAIVALQWKGNDITETWSSPELSRDIIDFDFFRHGSSDTMMFLTRNELGKYFLETIR
jgi:hypothetical protein